MRLKNAAFAKDMKPIDDSCNCMTCQQYTRWVGACKA
jgi:tRNA-guanine family transglycosylase